ncbi:hypothetical protein niasHS_001618 [Heterodera schachtii]|uniref:Transmembrane protein n=1 Tax=Heterodera schachtii TaxID=97005 RepID=A0ABD2KE83_HETSC
MFSSFVPSSSSSVLLLLFLLHFFFSLFSVCSLFVSHGIRQRNSSVPLRELVDTSRASALISPIPGPAGRQAIFGVEECPYCDPKKCFGTRPTGGRVGLCLSIRDGDGLLVSSRCVGSRKELNRAMSVRQMPPTARNRRQGCERSATEEGEAEEELCWCESTQHRKSLLEEGLALPNRASAIQHARRRKNHPPGISTAYGRQPVDKDGTANGQKELSYPHQRLHQSRNSRNGGAAVKRKSDKTERNENGTGRGSAVGKQWAIGIVAIVISCCWTRLICLRAVCCLA